MDTRFLIADLTLPGDGPPIKDPLAGRFANISDVVNQAMPIIFALAGLTLLGYLVWGGFEVLTAMGDPEKAASGKGRITNAVVGFVLIFVAYWLTEILKYMFNIT